MEFIIVENPEAFKAKEIYQSYCNAFPVEERRDANQFNALFRNPKAKVISVLSNLNDIGYIILWELSEFVFIEHFEIFSDFRSQNYGSQILKELCKNQARIVLETEPEMLNNEAKRRIDFYNKNGFILVDENYLQPSYGEGKPEVSLWLLANWKPDKIDCIKEEIYDVVYCRN